MIASIHGEIGGINEDSLVIVVGGIGIRVYVTHQMRAQARVGDRLFLHTHLVVREDALNLYGFELERERDFFNLLLGVNGIGPRLAMNILSTLTVDAIRRAVLGEQAEILSRVPGVGRKTAQKILLSLQGKVGEAGPLEFFPALEVDAQVLEALTALGYSVVEAQTALQSIPRDTPLDVESRLRLALQYFGG